MCIDKISIPESQQELVADIQYFLRLAATHGFIKTPSIKITSEAAFLVITENNKIVVSNDLSDAVVNSDIGVSYLGTHSLLPASLQVFVNVTLQDKLVDRWTNSSGEHVVDCSHYEKACDPNKHFAAFIAMLGLNFCVDDALVLARAFQHVSRETWPEFCHFPQPLLMSNEQTLYLAGNQHQKLKQVNVRKLALYPVVDCINLLESLLKLGVTTAQLRIKSELTDQTKKDIVKAIALGRKYNAQVFINDHWQYAIEKGAFGVHLGQEDLVDCNVSAIVDSDTALGLSTHGYYELLKIIRLHPSYIALGHIFPTTTKVMPSLPQGLIRLKLYVDLIQQANQITQRAIPTVAIGGIDLTNAKQVLATGVDSLAVVRAVTLSENLADTVYRFNQLITEESDSSIEVLFNGNKCNVDSGMTIAKLIGTLGIDSIGCVASVNNEVVSRNQWKHTVIEESDSISIFSAIAGG